MRGRLLAAPARRFLFPRWNEGLISNSHAGSARHSKCEFGVGCKVLMGNALRQDTRGCGIRSTGTTSALNYRKSRMASQSETRRFAAALRWEGLTGMLMSRQKVDFGGLNEQSLPFKPSDFATPGFAGGADCHLTIPTPSTSRLAEVGKAACWKRWTLSASNESSSLAASRSSG